MTRICYTFDDYDLDRFSIKAESFGDEHYSYVVTPNADHLIRLHDEPEFRETYSDADFILLDSRFLSYVVRCLWGLRLPVCTGSDLTARLFERIINAEDPIVLIGGTDKQASLLRQMYGLQRLSHYNPPMGFISDPDRVEDCLSYIEEHSPFRFCLIAVGSPQQEILANRLGQRGIARGLALCVGASINFITGSEQRAPRWMQKIGSEWLFRLMRDPVRLARRYLVRGPRVFRILLNSKIELRPLPQSKSLSIS